MKKSWIVLCAAAGLLASTGCQAASGKPTAVEPQSKAAAPAKEEPKPIDKNVITQEPTGIKLRVESKAYDRFFGMSEDGPLIPALMQDYVPQGLSYLKEKDWLLLSYYADDKRPSLLAVVERSTGRFVKAFKLYKKDGSPYVGHAGGVAVSEKFVWISSDSTVHAVKIGDLVRGENGGKLTFAQEQKIETNGSFVTYADHVLWVGEFARINYKTKESHHMKGRSNEKITGWVTGYKLDDATGTIANQPAEASGIPGPDFIFAIPEEIQGMSVLPDRILLSRSYGRNADSDLVVYPNPLKEKAHSQIDGLSKSPVPLWYLDAKNEQDRIVMPPASEGTVDVGDKLYILYESAAYDVRTSGTYPLDQLKVMDLSKLGKPAASP